MLQAEYLKLLPLLKIAILKKLNGHIGIFVYDMFLFLHEAQFTGYADDNTLFLVRNSIKDEVSALEEIGKKTFILVL